MPSLRSSKKPAYKGLPYPSPMASSYRCVKVTIPDSQEDTAALIAAIDFLTKWVAWKPQGNREEVDQAQLWKVALETTLDTIYDDCDTGDTGCTDNTSVDMRDIMLLRQSETEPCKIEYSLDGVTWCVLYDASICAAPPYPYPEPSTPEEIPALAAARLLQWIMSINAQIDIDINAGLTAPQIAYNIYNYPGIPQSPDAKAAVRKVIDEMITKTPVQRDPLIDGTEPDYQDLYDLLACLADPQGAWETADAPDIVNGFATALNTVLNEYADLIGLMGTTGALKYGGYYQQIIDAVAWAWSLPACLIPEIDTIVDNYAVGVWTTVTIETAGDPDPPTYEEMCIGGVYGWTVCAYELQVTSLSVAQMATSYQNGGVYPSCYAPDWKLVHPGAYVAPVVYLWGHGLEQVNIEARAAALGLIQQTYSGYWDNYTGDGDGICTWAVISSGGGAGVGTLRIRPIYKQL